MKKLHQTITPQERDRRMQGAHRIAPGLWADAEGSIHFSIPELLHVFGWPDDPEHRALVQEEIERFAEEHFPTAAGVVTVDVES